MERFGMELGYTCWYLVAEEDSFACVEGKGGYLMIL